MLRLALTKKTGSGRKTHAGSFKSSVNLSWNFSQRHNSTTSRWHFNVPIYPLLILLFIYGKKTKQNKIKTITSFCNLEEKIQSLALRLAFLSDILLCSIYCTHSNIPFLALPLNVFVSQQQSPPFLLQAQDKISFCNSPSSLLSFCLIIILPFNLVTIYLCFPRIFFFFYTKLTLW